MKRPKVSVIVPCYNSQSFIKRTIESALKQTYTNLEIIVVDDGSKDNTGDIIKSFNDARIKYFYQENNGLSFTRNVAIKHATGEYVAFLDHDDQWLPEKIEKQLRLFERNPELGLVFSDAYMVSSERKTIACFKERKPSRGNIFYEYLLSDNFVPLLTVLTPKVVISRYMPFDDRYKISEEFDLFLRIARDYKFDYVDEPLGNYYIHDANTIRINPERAIKEKFEIVQYWLGVEPSIEKLYRRQLRKRFAYLYSQLAVCYLESQHYSAAIKNLLYSFRRRKLNFIALKSLIKLVFKFLKLDWKVNNRLTRKIQGNA